MGLFDFLKKKKKSEAIPGNEAADADQLGVIAPPEIAPPETRYTQEYRDFLASQEQAEEDREPSDELSGEE